MKPYYIIVILGFLFFGCNKLEPEYSRDLSEEQLWSDKDFTLRALDRAYFELPEFYSDEFGGFLDCATDNAVTNDFNSGLIALGAVGISQLNNPLNSWKNAYTQIRTINKFIEVAPTLALSNDPDYSSKLKERSKGEAFFLRAWYQFELLSRFAGIDESGVLLGYPIILTQITEDEAAKAARNTFDECVDQILADINVALDYLPQIQYSGLDKAYGATQVGRAYKLAALSLKSKVLLYAASPAYTVGKGEAQVKTLWEDAAIAANDAILVIGSLPSITNALYKDPGNKEIIWRSYQQKGNDPEKDNFMPSLWGNGRTNPSQQLVDAFPMSDGYPATVSGLFNPANPYASRDKRLALSVVYNNESFGGQTAEIYKGGKDYASGLSTRATRTGYYLAKFMNSSVKIEPGTDNTTEKHYYAFFRCGEIWLNFAEAANEAWGPASDDLALGKTAQSALAQLRARAGITGGDQYLVNQANAGKDSFRALIQNERRIELCFENQRFFDVRRWMLPLVKLNEPVKGVEITKNADNSFSFDYNVEVESRKFESYMYYNPIPEQAVAASGSMITQNKGW